MVTEQSFGFLVSADSKGVAGGPFVSADCKGVMAWKK